jgi:short-subunit dehydrogenase
VSNTSDFVLLTGASSGIGLELARVFAREGRSLVLVARTGERLKALSVELENSFGVKTEIIEADLALPEAPQLVYQHCKARNITVDCLVNNAGFGDHARFEDCDWEKQQRMIAVNITALVLLTRLFLPRMVQSGSGRILNVSSLAAFQPGPSMSVYCATKSFVLSFSEALRFELLGTGVSVTTLCPGPTESGFVDVANMQGIRLFQDRKVPSSRDVAEYAYRALVSRKSVAIHGSLNRVAALLSGCFPRNWVLRISNYMTGKVA